MGDEKKTEEPEAEADRKKRIAAANRKNRQTFAGEGTEKHG